MESSGTASDLGGCGGCGDNCPILSHLPSPSRRGTDARKNDGGRALHQHVHRALVVYARWVGGVRADDDGVRRGAPLWDGTNRLAAWGGGRCLRI